MRKYEVTFVLQVSSQGSQMPIDAARMQIEAVDFDAAMAFGKAIAGRMECDNMGGDDYFSVDVQECPAS